jgi:hypothetical protein
MIVGMKIMNRFVTTKEEVNFAKATDDIGEWGSRGRCCGTCLEWLDESCISACYKYGWNAEFYYVCDDWRGLNELYE